MRKTSHSHRTGLGSNTESDHQVTSFLAFALTVRRRPTDEVSKGLDGDSEEATATLPRSLAEASRHADSSA
jgi:hypothetical protein